MKGLKHESLSVITNTIFMECVIPVEMTGKVKIILNNRQVGEFGKTKPVWEQREMLLAFYSKDVSVIDEKMFNIDFS